VQHVVGDEMEKKTVLALLLSVLLVLAVTATFSSVVHGEILQDWQVGPPKGGQVSEANGVLTMSGGNGHDVSPCLYRDFKPTNDFEISFDLKAESLGEVLLDQAGEGFVFSFGKINVTSSQDDRAAGFWMRARGGGQLLLCWHDNLCDQYGWQSNWQPFVYDTLEYNNGYDFWHPNPPQDRSNAPVKPDVWYTIRLKVTEVPFIMTGEVYAENGSLLDSLSVDSMNNFAFKDIDRLYMSTGAGGTFYIRNLAIGNLYADAKTFLGWQVADDSGDYAESDGVITLSGNEQNAGTTLYKYISPQTDFEISLQVKAETLGEVHRDPSGAGEGFVILLRPNASVFGVALGINFELRARGGGQFLVLRHNNVADTYGWPYDWTPFIYNSLEYNDGSSFWQYSSSEVKANAPVKPDIWYTMKLKIRQAPFLITSEVLTENGTLLGSFPISDINNFGFGDIKCVGISSGFGGTFYVRNFTNGVSTIGDTVVSISAEPSITLGSPVHIYGSLTNGGVALPNELVMLKYSFLGAEEWYPIGSALTDASGNYSIQWINTATGTFFLRAEWKGNDELSGAYADITLNSLPSQSGIFFVESNSTVTSLSFNSTTSELSFTVSGPSGTSGYVKAAIAKNLVSNAENIRVYLDGNLLNYGITSNEDSWFLFFTYTHSEHNVNVDLGVNTSATGLLVISTWTWIFIVAIPVAIGTSMLVYWKKRKRQD
jgi:hypothetical protein